MRAHLRFAVIAFLIVATALVLEGRNEIIAPHESLTSFPVELGKWVGTDVPIPQDALEVLGAGDFLLRVYQNPEPQHPDVDLFVAYFPSQRTGDTIHSPKHCLPGAGWSPVAASRITVSLPGQPSFPANQYVIAKGEGRQLVLYWYLAHDRALASEYWAKFYLVTDSIRLHRSDGALIRLITPLPTGEAIDSARQRLLAFAQSMVPLLNRYVPS
jgi:EpsI family protein